MAFSAASARHSERIVIAALQMRVFPLSGMDADMGPLGTTHSASP
jgi:hypothetical protein